MKYFLVIDNVEYPGRWFLGPLNLPLPFDFWKFTGLGPVIDMPTDLQIGITGGRVLDFTFSDFSIPIINDKTASFLPENEIQLINVQAGKFDNLFILMVLNEVDCVDETLSDFRKFTKEDPIRPDKAGKYALFYKLILDKKKCDKF